MKKTAIVSFVAGAVVFAAVAEESAVTVKEVEWTGGGETSSWRTGTNWKGGTPPAEGDIAVIPAGVEAVAACKDDVDFMNTLSKVELSGPGAVLCVSNLEAAVSMTVRLAGDGTFVHRDQKNNGSKNDLCYYPLTLNADNSGFTGEFVSTNAGLKVSHAKALGGESGGNVRVALRSYQRFGVFGNIKLYNDLAIKGVAYSQNYFFSANTSSWYGDIRVGGGLSFHSNNSDHTLAIYGDVTVDGNYELRWSTGGTVVYYGRVKGSTGAASAYGAPHLGGECHSKNFGRLFLGGTIKCLATNVFAVGYNEMRFGSNRSGILDLNGFDQELSGIWQVAGEYGAVFKSDRPAVLSMIDNDGANIVGQYYYLDGKGADVFCGQVTFVHVPTNAANALKRTLCLTNMTCSTSGGIEAAYGTLTIGANAGFANLTRLALRGTGSMVVDSDGLGNASDGLAVSLQGSGTLTIAEDIVIRARTATAGVKSDGTPRWLRPGTYTRGNLPGRILGDGSLVVSEYGGRDGFILNFL